jgi:hypothetical protein
MLATLRADYGVRRVVCEGGPRLFRALLEEQLVDELHLTLAPRIFGGAGAPTLTGLAGDFPHAPPSACCGRWNSSMANASCATACRADAVGARKLDETRLRLVPKLEKRGT